VAAAPSPQPCVDRFRGTRNQAGIERSITRLPFVGKREQTVVAGGAKIDRSVPALSNASGGRWDFFGKRRNTIWNWE
jgi:hypothetical protein